VSVHWLFLDRYVLAADELVNPLLGMGVSYSHRARKSRMLEDITHKPAYPPIPARVDQLNEQRACYWCTLAHRNLGLHRRLATHGHRQLAVRLGGCVQVPGCGRGSAVPVPGPEGPELCWPLHGWEIGVWLASIAWSRTAGINAVPLS